MQHVFVFTDAQKNGIVGGNSVSLITLQHPRTGMTNQFACAFEKIYEIQSVESSNPSSWIIDQRIQSNGKMFVCTPVNPLYLILNELESHQSSFVLLDQIRNGNIPLLLKYCTQSLLEEICEVKPFEEDRFLVKLDQEKVKIWLLRKMDAVSAVLHKQGQTSPVLGSSVATFCFNAGASSDSPEAKLHIQKQSFEFLSEYLSESFADLLKRNLPEIKVVIEQVATPISKRVIAPAQSGGDHEHSTSVVEEPPVKKLCQPAPTLSLAQKKLQKVDKRGMSALTSYFSKKA